MTEQLAEPRTMTFSNNSPAVVQVELLAPEYLLMNRVMFARIIAIPIRRSEIARLKRNVLNISAASINPFRKHHIWIEFSIQMRNPTNNINMVMAHILALSFGYAHVLFLLNTVRV